MGWLFVVSWYNKTKAIDIAVPRNQLLSLLDRDRDIFEQVKEPCFVHWDIWAGNVFVQEDKITGIIDFERCLWADPLMEVDLRTCWYEKAFFDGYGLTELNQMNFLTINIVCHKIRILCNIDE